MVAGDTPTNAAKPDWETRNFLNNFCICPDHSGVPFGILVPPSRIFQECNSPCEIKDLRALSIYYACNGWVAHPLRDYLPVAAPQVLWKIKEGRIVR